MKVTLDKIARGSVGAKGFFISTFRFPLEVAQSVEKIALGEGLSMSSVINQVLAAFVESRKVPTDIKPVKTAHATTWNTGDGPKSRGASKKDDEAPAKKTKKLVKKAKKVVEVEEDEEEKPAKKSKKPAKAALSVLKKIKKAKVVEEDEGEEASDADLDDAMDNIPD